MSMCSACSGHQPNEAGHCGEGLFTVCVWEPKLLPEQA